MKIDKNEEDPSPMWGVSNMSDVMLVLAVGIMLALVANWNLDIQTGMAKEMSIESSELEELDELETIEDKEFLEKIKNSRLEELGNVYVDPKTGKMYVIVQEEKNSEKEN